MAHSFFKPQSRWVFSIIFNPTTRFTFTLQIYNLLGQRVRTLVDGVREAGSHTVVWDGRDESGNTLPSGVYLYRLRAGKFVEARKMLLLR